MTPIKTNEAAFETAIDEYLLSKAGGYLKGDRDGYDAKLGLFPAETLAFIEATQPIGWGAIGKMMGTAERDTQFIAVLADWLDKYGTLETLRRGVAFAGQTIQMAYFAPSSGLNEDLLLKVKKNRVTITRQVFFNPHTKQSVDVVGAVNGIPVWTSELKNPFTGQTYEDAITQYQQDRDPKTKIFQPKARSVVHFAVDPNWVFMATELTGASTRFLPFNKGNGMGKGNPTAEGFKTAYLWEEVLTRDSLLDILARFVQVETPKARFSTKKKGAKSDTAPAGPPKLLFPRYHQLRAVRRIEAACKQSGPGTNYLVQHSAGSGKTNTISWLAYRLQSLHDANDKKVYDSVIVVTDRTVLDDQLGDAIYQFDHKRGVVLKIDDNSQQLAEALKARVPIIITTIQKFPFAKSHLDEALPDGHYAVIIDEAHSSQSGENAVQMKGTLSGKRIAAKAKAAAAEQGKEGSYEEEVLRRVLARAKQDNLSFFAFTATPKHKTFELFGTKDATGKPVAFDLYPMRQAIEEGFIRDVLENYTTYKVYWELVDKASANTEVERRAAVKALARFVNLNPAGIEQKVEIIINHFRSFTAHKIGGKAKAMVVTSSREAAVRYKQAFDRYLTAHKIADVKSLVAFSGHIVLDEDPTKHTEGSMNDGIQDPEIRERFAGDEYQVLLVADKYQTGFDEPLLHTMYVDKRLDGVQAVQTLSRLNRTYPGKIDTFVLDFVNEPDDIRAAFQPFYEATSIIHTADPQILYHLQVKLLNYRLFDADTVQACAEVYFGQGAWKENSKNLAKLYAVVMPVADAWKLIQPDEKQDEFKSDLQAFLNLYGFLAQVMPYQDARLEQLYVFGRFLADAIRSPGGTRLDLSDMVGISYFKAKLATEGGIALTAGGENEVKGPTAVGTAMPKEHVEMLSDIIARLNERFHTDFTEADRVVFDGMKAEAMEDAELQVAAQVNSLENFAIAYKKKEQEIAINRMDKNQDLMEKYFNDDAFRAFVSDRLVVQVFDALQAAAKAGTLPNGRPAPGVPAG